MQIGVDAVVVNRFETHSLALDTCIRTSCEAQYVFSGQGFPA